MMFELGNAYKNQLIDNYTDNKYYSDALEIDINDKNSSKALIAKYIKKGSDCLDVGCGSGYLGKLLKNTKKANVYGIEIDEEAIKYAAKTKSFADLFNFSITEREGYEYDRFLKNDLKFDYIIFADVLEHVLFAEDVLMFFAKFLKPDGKIIISLPNIAHFDIVKGLIDGKFNYNHIGLLDNTHLRFYTKSSFREFIDQINDMYEQKFSLKQIGKTIIKPEYIGNYPNLYKILNKNRETCVLQYLYEISLANKKPKEKQRVEPYVFDEIEVALDRIKAVEYERDKLQNKVVELEKGMNEIYNSSSWRITKPIRNISKIIKKVRRK